MKIDIEVRQGLQRCLTIVLEDEHYKQRVLEQSKIIDNAIKTKVIMASKNIVQTLDQQFDVNVREQIFHNLMTSNFAEAASQSELIIAGIPNFEIVEIASGNGFIYKAIFEIYPTVELPKLETYNFTQLVAQVAEEDVDRTLSVLRRQQAEWCSVDRPARAGDSVIINCYAKVGERVFDGKSMRVELTDDVVTGFEKALVGVVVGEKLPIEINFSADHYQADVAGKAVVFDVEVLQIEALVLPELDADFIRSSGIESGEIAAMRSVIRRNMDTHLQKTIRLKNTLTIFSEILKDNPIDSPQPLIEEELKRLTCDPCEEVEGVESFKHDIDPAMFTDLAYTRVARSLLVDELAKVKGVVLDEQEVRARVEDLVAEYPQKEKIIDWFYGNKVRLAGIKSDVLGEQVADLILKNTQPTIIQTSYAAMMNFGGNKK
ncbi:MAG: trigger factor [Gammaproteobacteria bacterium]